MRDSTQTLIGAVRAAVQAWRKREDWSRETVCQEIVSTFTHLRGEVPTRIKFDPNTQDVYDRQRIIAERIYRWLDDESKDNNLLPANFLPYILAALPVDLRIACADGFLGCSDLSVRLVSHEAEDSLTIALQHMAKEGGEALSAMTNLLDGCTPDQLSNAQRELTEAVHAAEAALAVIEQIKAGKA